MTDEAAAHRYAVYYAPPPESPLERFGVGWLGRHHRTGERLAQPAVAGIDADRLRALTAAPRRYGFHGTLKAPFRLARGCKGDDLHAAVEAFARSRSAFTLPPLVVADLAGFLALVPSAPAPALDELAAASVRAFEPFRAPLTAEERARRPVHRLSARQRRHLESFGYPHVFEDFAFHMTLTERLAETEKSILLPQLQDLAAGPAAEPLSVDAIAVYEEPRPGAPFHLTARFAFGA